MPVLYTNSVSRWYSVSSSRRAGREANPELKGNIRDYATVNELICLANMENINAVLIDEGIP